MCYNPAMEWPCYKVAASLNLHKRGGGADGDVYFPGLSSVWYIFNYTACLY